MVSCWRIVYIFICKRLVKREKGKIHSRSGDYRNYREDFAQADLASGRPGSSSLGLSHSISTRAFASSLIRSVLMNQFLRLTASCHPEAQIFFKLYVVWSHSQAINEGSIPRWVESAISDGYNPS